MVEKRFLDKGTLGNLTFFKGPEEWSRVVWRFLEIDCTVAA
jgi:hypothetical protein